MSVTKSGIPGLAEIDWGACVCHFYDSRRELLDTVLPFLQAGLQNNEACLWLTAEPLTAADARASLSAGVPDFAQREQNGQIEIVDREKWSERIGLIEAMDAWIQRKQLAFAQGFSGLRLADNVVRHSSADAPIDERFGEQQIVGLFSYSLAHCSAHDVLEVASRCQFTWARRANAGKTPTTSEQTQTQPAWLERRSGGRSRPEDRLREAETRNNEFMGMLGHELRNPLASITTANQLMMLRGGELHFPKELHIIQRQVSHITAMINDLLDMSRIIAGKVQLQFASLEIVEAIDRAVEIAAPLVDKRVHRLQVSCPPHGLAVNGDPARLTQIVASLLNNAARYTEPGGDITLKAERNGGNVAVIVTDTGRGIEPSRLAAIFQPFVGSRRRRDGGLGLGLSIVRSLVALHGGTVEVASTVGKGSRFVVRLPALESSPSGIAP